MKVKDEQIKIILNDFNKGKTSHAFNQLAKLLKKNPEDLDYIYTYAKMCIQISKLKESEKALKFLLSKKSNSITYLHTLYSVYIKTNNIKEAEKYIIKLLAIDDNLWIGTSYGLNKYNLSNNLNKRLI